MLSDLAFLVVTGTESNVFFARDPLLAHTLGVALSQPAKCGIDDTYFDVRTRQLMLRFPGPKDPEHRKTLE